jgi:hypothetical protein
MFQIIYHEFPPYVIGSSNIFINLKWHQYISSDFDLLHDRGFDLIWSNPGLRGIIPEALIALGYEPERI